MLKVFLSYKVFQFLTTIPIPTKKVFNVWVGMRSEIRGDRRDEMLDANSARPGLKIR